MGGLSVVKSFGRVALKSLFCCDLSRHRPRQPTRRTVRSEVPSAALLLAVGVALTGAAARWSQANLNGTGSSGWLPGGLRHGQGLHRRRGPHTGRPARRRSAGGHVIRALLTRADRSGDYKLAADPCALGGTRQERVPARPRCRISIQSAARAWPHPRIVRKRSRVRIPRTSPPFGAAGDSSPVVTQGIPNRSICARQKACEPAIRLPGGARMRRSPRVP